MAANEVIEGQKAFNEYAMIQGRLCAALFERYGLAEDRFLANIPWSGLLKMDGEVWQFKKHGLGVLFEQLSNHVILDVHRNIQACSTCFDTWRLAQYFESKGVLSLNVGSKVYAAQEELSLANMLGDLVDAGIIVWRRDLEAFSLI